MASSPSCPCCDAHIFKLVRSCVHNLWSSCMWFFTSHICNTIHYTNNTMAYNIQQNMTPHCCLTYIGQKIFSRGKFGVFIKFDRLAWSQIFCLTFCENFGNFCPTFRSSNNLNVSMCSLTNRPTLAFLTVKNIQCNIPHLENWDDQWRPMIIVMSSIDRTCNLQFISWTRWLKLTLIPLSSMGNWWRIEWHSDIIRLVGLQYIEIKPLWSITTLTRWSGNFQRCAESEIFDSDFAPASVEYTLTPLRHILKFLTPTAAQTPKWII